MVVLLTAMAVLLPLLAALQYYWLGQVSQGASERLQSSLSVSATAFRRDFNREFIRAYLNFHIDSLALPADVAKYHADCLEQWNQSAPYPQLIRDVFVVNYDEQGPHLSRLDAQAKRFEAQEWTSELLKLRERFEQHSLESFAEEIPALIIPFPPATTQEELSQAGPVKFQRSKSPPSPPGFTLIKLDLNYIQREFIPLLLERHLFDDAHKEYNAAIVSLKDPKTVIYSSGLFAGDFISPDVSTQIFGLEADELEAFLKSKGTSAATAEQPPGKPSRLIKFRILRRPAMRGSQAAGPGAAVENSSIASRGDDGRWLLLIKHQSGSLAAAVSSARHRNLAISFGILLLLGAGILMTAISTRRAERLAQQQINFVAGVSHELRTPLAVICSAGENLADGIVDNPQKAAQYGEVIYREGRRLTDMLEQVLEFAGAQSGRQRYEFRPTDVRHFIDGAVAACQSQMQERNFELETLIPPDLPRVYGDGAALRRALQNLITNAIKYAKYDGNKRWARITAQTTHGKNGVSGDNGNKVRITVEDHGLGISSTDIPHIFEPFYRGHEAVAAQIEGSGVGLSLVKQIVEAHGGKISVKSTPGTGSTFTIQLPIAENDPRSNTKNH
jgi:signal transduction histidine kinase